jgi:acyl-CoA-binding protein
MAELSKGAELASIRAQFATAHEEFRAVAVLDGRTPRQSLVWRLYGLSKQVFEGDCRVERPSEENTTMFYKWDAWKAVSGVSREDAMRKFLENMSSFRALQTGVDDTEEAEIKQKRGILYKKRDVMSGWRPRLFELTAEGALQYFVESDGKLESVPKMVYDLGSMHVKALPSVQFEDVELFPFSMTKTDASKEEVCRVASTSKSDTADWLEKIQTAMAVRASVSMSTPSKKAINGKDAGKGSSMKNPIAKSSETSRETLFNRAGGGPNGSGNGSGTGSEAAQAAQAARSSIMKRPKFDEEDEHGGEMVGGGAGPSWDEVGDDNDIEVHH